MSQRANAGVKLEPDGQYFEGYNSTVSAAIINAFATVALRMGHTLIREDFAVDNGTRPVADLRREPVDFFRPELLFDETLGVDPYGGIFLGLVLDRALRFDA